MLSSMNKQSQIKRTLSRSTSIDFIKDLLSGSGVTNRAHIAKHVCAHFGFRDARGELQTSGCQKALRELEASGHFKLPKAKHKTGPKSPRRLPEAVPLPDGVPDEVTDISCLELVLVQNEEQIRIWNELMLSEHYLGTAILVGRQLRYLIRSEQGWLGGLGFAAPALQLADRDRWIGWDQATRQAQLHRLVGMSRFLIRPSVNCTNLASKVLSMSLAALGDDFERQYGDRPLLVESFVETERYAGTCYRAANWIEVGQTKGRGRQDRDNQSALSQKTIGVYPLDPTFRTQLGLSANAGLGALEIADGLDEAHWSTHEFGGAQLGDQRLSRRLVSVAHAKAQQPGRAFSGTVQGDWAATKAYYRMIDQPDDSALTPDAILQPHRERTARRMMGQHTVLCIQDGSDLNYTNLDQCRGLGDLKANQTGAKTKGLHLHSTFAVAPNGLPLGVLKAQCLAPQSRCADDKRKPSAIPIEEKKTFVWIEHYRDLVDLKTSMPQTQLVTVCDREADFFELFDEQRRNPGVELLIRAHHDRNLNEAPFKLFAAVRDTPVQSRVRVSIPQHSARPKKSKQKAKPARPGRHAELVLRQTTRQLPAPGAAADQEPIEINLIHALEDNPPEGEDPVEWFLLTTLRTDSATDIERCLRWYTLRWRIEDWHRVLKSGCRIGDLAHETAERLRRAIAINLVIAWRIMLMTLLGRETPELPAEIVFSDVELRVLRAYAEKKRLKPPASLGDAVHLVARLGGYLARNSDPPPGHQVMWSGYAALQLLAAGYQLADDG